MPDGEEGAGPGSGVAHGTLAGGGGRLVGAVQCAGWRAAMLLQGCVPVAAGGCVLVRWCFWQVMHGAAGHWWPSTLCVCCTLGLMQLMPGLAAVTGRGKVSCLT